MAVTTRDKHGTLTKRRKAEGPQLDRRSARYFAIVAGTWSCGFPTRREAESAGREMQSRSESGVNLAAGSMTLAEFLRSVWLATHVAKVQRGQLKAGSAAHYTLMAEKYVIPTLGDKRLATSSPHICGSCTRSSGPGWHQSRFATSTSRSRMRSRSR